ncbi:MAG: hypothetical protein AAB404_01180 [Patescibacteria group bacterium]
MDGIAIIGIIVVIFALGHPVGTFIAIGLGILYVFSEVTELREYGAYIQFAQNFVEERIKRQDFDESRIKEIIEALKKKKEWSTRQNNGLRQEAIQIWKEELIEEMIEKEEERLS